MNFYNFAVWAIGVLGIIANLISFQCKRHKPLMIFKTGNELLFSVQYFMLGAYTGLAMNLIGCLRNVIFTKLVENGKSTKLYQGIFSAVFLAFMCATWSGFNSMIVGFAKVVSTIAYGNSKTSIVRILIFFTSVAWLVYNLSVGSYTGAICEALTLCSIIAGIIRIDILKQKSNA